MRCLIVIAHPLPSSLCHALAARTEAELRAAGHEVVVEDLYANGFHPALTGAERESFYLTRYDTSGMQAQVDRLQAAQALVLCFPTWWFGPPAILKGWFDRVWGPGIAYDHATDLGLIQPRLRDLRQVLAITTLGSPFWVDWLVMRRPLRRVLRHALIRACAPQARFAMLSLYQAEAMTPQRLSRFATRIKRTVARWR